MTPAARWSVPAFVDSRLGREFVNVGGGVKSDPGVPVVVVVVVRRAGGRRIGVLPTLARQARDLEDRFLGSHR